MLYLSSLIWILSINGLLVLLLKKEFEKTLILSFSLGSLILYIFSFFNQLRIGYYFTWIFVLLFYFLLYKNKDNLKEFKDNYFRSSLFVFLILLIYLFIRYHNQGFSQCDDFMHWGPMVLASIKNNGFYLLSDILKVHQDYPPFMTMYRMLWVGFNNFKYSETYLFVSQLIFFYSCLLPLFSFIKGKYKYLKEILLTISIILIGLCIPMTPTAQEWALLYNSIYLDFIIVAYSAYILLFALNYKYKYLFLTVMLSSLLLFKQIGICYYALIVFYLLIKCLKDKDEFDIKKILLVIFIPILVYITWSVLIKYMNIGGQFVINEMKFSDIFTMFNDKEGYLYTVFSLFVKTLLTRKLMLGISFFLFVIIVCIILIVLNNKDSFLLAITYLLGSLGYSLTMLLLYMLSFDPVEALVLASFDRYMLSYQYFGILLIFISTIIKLSNYELKHLYYHGLAFFLLLLCIEYSSIKDILPSKLNNIARDSVLIIDSVDGFNTYREELNGLNFEFNYSKINKENISVEEFVKEVKENDFLYIYEYDSKFFDKYRPALDEGFDPYVKVLYEIKVNGDTFEFIPLHIHFNTRVVEYYMIPKPF